MLQNNTGEKGQLYNPMLITKKSIQPVIYYRQPVKLATLAIMVYLPSLLCFCVVHDPYNDST